MKVLRGEKPSGLGVVLEGQARPSPTRVEILDSAARLIVDGGYEAFTMRAVALRVNIKAGSLYHHFKSKEEIVEEILNSGVAMLLEQVQAKLRDVPSDAAFADRIRIAIQAHIAGMLGRDTVYMQVYEHLPPVLKRRSRAMRDKYAKIWFGIFEDGVKSGEIDPGINLSLFVPYLLGALNRVPEWFRQTKFKSTDIVDVVTKTLLSGVAAKSPKSKSGARAQARS
jgi:AcrR family transcriptional regulator